MTNFYIGFFQFSIWKHHDGVGPYCLYATIDDTNDGYTVGRYASIKEARIAAHEYVIEEAEDLLKDARNGLVNERKED
jgi:hypothetical protein